MTAMIGMRRRRHRQAGMTYVEVVMAVLLLGVCLAPALQAIGSHTLRRAAATDAGRDLACLLEALEHTVAVSYGMLKSAATSTQLNGIFLNPSATYSRPPSAACPNQRNVYILKYDPALADPFATTSDKILYVRVEQAGGMKTATLVIRYY